MSHKRRWGGVHKSGRGTKAARKHKGRRQTRSQSVAPLSLHCALDKMKRDAKDLHRPGQLPRAMSQRRRGQRALAIAPLSATLPRHPHASPTSVSKTPNLQLALFLIRLNKHVEAPVEQEPIHLVCAHATANPVRCIHHHHRETRVGNSRRRRQTSHTSADNDHVGGRAAEAARVGRHRCHRHGRRPRPGRGGGGRGEAARPTCLPPQRKTRRRAAPWGRPRGGGGGPRCRRRRRRRDAWRRWWCRKGRRPPSRQPVHGSREEGGDGYKCARSRGRMAAVKAALAASAAGPSRGRCGRTGGGDCGAGRVRLEAMRVDLRAAPEAGAATSGPLSGQLVDPYPVGGC